MLTKTKIVATLGPASSRRDTILDMIRQGVDVFRINFSHGSFVDYANLLAEIRTAQADSDRITAVMGDLCGPKIRTSVIEPAGDILIEGQEVTISGEDIPGSAKCFGTNYEHFVNDVQVGDRIFIDDGELSLLAVNKTDTEVTCKVIAGGPLNTRKGINLPDTTVSIPSMTDYDLKCADWALENGLDFLALSFVRSGSDVVRLRECLSQKSGKIEIVSKIETPQAVADLENVIDASDAVLVARGDLGVEMDLAEVPLIQKRITRMCADKGKPCIVATQMLQSMIYSASPTRAEVSDVANAVIDLTDAVMLSGETAVGKYPVEAVKILAKIACSAEAYLDSIDEPRHKIITDDDGMQIFSSLAPSVAQIVDQVDTKIVTIWSEEGRSAMFFSKSRIDTPIMAFTSDKRVASQMCMHYGVLPQINEIPKSLEDFIVLTDVAIIQSRYAAVGDKIIIVVSAPIGTGDDSIIVHTVGSKV